MGERPRVQRNPLAVRGCWRVFLFDAAAPHFATMDKYGHQRRPDFLRTTHTRETCSPNLASCYRSAKGGRKGGLESADKRYYVEIAVLFDEKWCRLRDSNT